MRRPIILASLAGAVLLTAVALGWWFLQRPPHAAPAATIAQAHYVGTQACAQCHDKQHAAWQGSQHQLAMQHATPASVLGDFNDAHFTYAGVTSTFFQRDGKYFVRTDGKDGKLADFEVKYTYGVAPLQQYLVEFPDGRIQALSIAWDTRPKSQGGQRWYHLYPKERITHTDPLHWTRASQNWNFMCAECHSTDVHKNYDAASDTFKTTWSEISVGCEACHGAGSAHVDWARNKGSASDKGLAVRFDERAGAHWAIDAATGNAKRSAPRTTRKEIETCALCHARRGQIWEGHVPGRPLADTHQPALLSAGLYEDDGQMRDEVYNYGSFLQSRMYQQGVTCSDCHDPHSGKLREPGNGVCFQCHSAEKYGGQAHTGHPLDARARELPGLPHAGAQLHGRRSPPRPQLPRAAAGPEREVRHPERVQRLPQGQVRAVGGQRHREMARAAAQGPAGVDAGVSCRARRCRPTRRTSCSRSRRTARSPRSGALPPTPSWPTTCRPISSRRCRRGCTTRTRSCAWVRCAAWPVSPPSSAGAWRTIC